MFKRRVAEIYSKLLNLISKIFVKQPVKIFIWRGDKKYILKPEEYAIFEFQHGDEMSIKPIIKSAELPVAPDGTWQIQLRKGKSIRVPRKMEIFNYKEYRLPVHLVNLTGAGPETWEEFGKAHIANYKKFMGLRPDMKILEIGCGIGRDAMQFMDIINDDGCYTGIDVTSDSIEWCKNNITCKRPNFRFYHFDARHELYNPLGTKRTMDFALPVDNKSIDRMVLGSIFTHLFENEIVHYMKEIARVLKSSGLAYATFFLYSHETVTAARKTDNIQFKLRFEHKFDDGCYINDAAYPTGAVAYTDEAIKRMITQSGLQLQRDYLKGYWSGAFEQADDGQEVMILSPKPV